MIGLELSWGLIAPWCQARGCSWLLISAHLQSGTPMATLDCLWVLMSANRCSAHEWLWLLMSSSPEKPCLAPWSNEHSWELKSNYEQGALRLWHSSALMSAHGAITQYSWVLKRAHECTWVHMSASEGLWALMTGDEFWCCFVVRAVVVVFIFVAVHIGLSYGE